MLDLQLINDTSGKWKFNCVIVDGEPWFNGKEVAKLLGYADTRQAIRDHIDSEDKHKLEELIHGVSDTPMDYQAKNSIYISETGLYFLLDKCNKQEAVIFKRWIYKDVLPSIRKHGKYEVNQQQSILPPKYLLQTFEESMINQKRIFSLNNENDLHYKLIEYLRRFYPDARLNVSLGEMQVHRIGDVESNRTLEAYRKGYTRGACDITITNLHLTKKGLCIELKTPNAKGTLNADQDKYLYNQIKDGYDVIVSNDYDVIIIKINKHFEGVRVRCDYCKSLFKTEQSLKSHINGFHYNIRPICDVLSV